MIRCENLVTQRGVHLISIFSGDFFFLFLFLTLVSGADYRVLRSFPALRSDVTKVFFASRIVHG